MRNKNMRKLLIMISLLLQGVLQAQEQQYTEVFIHDNMFVQLVFESPIVSYKIGTAEALNVEQNSNNLTLQSIRMEDDTNLTVQTADNYYYAFILKHTKTTPKLFYEIKKQQAQNFYKMELAENMSRKERKETEEKSRTFLDIVLMQRGYINSHNKADKKKMSIENLGIYVNQEKLYFLFKVKNRSNINYEVNKLLFMSSSRMHRKKQIKPEEVEYNYSFIKPDFKNVNPKSEQKFVVVFDKFTLNDNKDLLCMLSELNGERVLEFAIPSERISDARRLQ